ncbi:acyltransferase papA2 [Streptomyces sp. AV19]|uniref:condensation domain-containing protein n=1 Tax=Streptomyces sp. AV19 TaxID=2793068 RepID=UPI0018FE4A7D|nr:condensation domain-containing protein [Streptomyces sp. AV19]MBH1937495.1 acyltransferase papA2 [Streptomyces sp. AV19]MDG4533729.1 condensation domain-containing protein [Streptomyces sp. AV19]
MTTLSEYRVRPGRLREWTLDAEPFREAAWPDAAGRPVSYNQEWHLRFSARLAARGVRTPMWMGFGFELPGPLDAEALRETLRLWVVRHETLRSGFRVTDAGLEHISIASEAVRVSDVVLGDFADDEDLRGCLEQRLDEGTGLNRWPGHVMETVDRTDSTSVIVALDHAYTDGLSAMTAIGEWQELYAAVTAGREVTHRGIGSYVDFGARERAAAERIGRDHPAVAHWERFIVAGGERLLEFPLALGVAKGELLPHVKLDVLLLDAPAAAAVEEVCHDAGGGFLAGLLAAFAMATQEITGDPVYRTVMPVHTRSRPEWLHSMGWYVGVGPVEIDLGTGATFREAVPAAHGAARVALSVGREPIARIAEVLGITEELERRMPEVFPFVSFIDLRVIPGARRWDEWNARPLVRMKSRGSKVNFWVNRTDEGVWLTARHPGTETAGDAVARFVERVRGVLHSVAKTGDYRATGCPGTNGETE